MVTTILQNPLPDSNNLPCNTFNMDLSTIQDYHSLFVLPHIHILGIIPFTIYFQIRLGSIKIFFIHHNLCFIYKLQMHMSVPQLLSPSLESIILYLSSSTFSLDLHRLCMKCINIFSGCCPFNKFNHEQLVDKFFATQLLQNFSYLGTSSAFHLHHIGVASIHSPKFPFGNHHHPHHPLGFCLKHLH